MLTIEHLQAGYDASRVLFDISLEVHAGEVVTLMGRNGMGKTTTVRTLFGLTRASAGRIDFGGRELRGLPTHRIAQLGIGLVPEGRQIFPTLSVHENLVATAANRSGRRATWTLDSVWELLPRLRERRDQMGNTLSGGEQQMLAIGRALMTNPRLLVLDEATEGLAPLVRDEIWQCLRHLKAANQAILLIDKNLDALLSLADRHYMVEKGRTVWSGDSAALRADAGLGERYLGLHPPETTSSG